MNNKNTIGSKVLTPEFRASFVSVFEPKTNQQGKEVYEITMLFPKKSDISVLKKAVSDLVNRVYPDKSKRPGNFRSPFRDGDLPNSMGNIFAGHPGNVVVRAWTKEKPGLVDEDTNDIIERSQFYSGCYARATVTPFIYNNSGNTGVSFFLNNIQKLRNGESLGGHGGPAANDFEPVAPEDRDSYDPNAFDKNGTGVKEESDDSWMD